MQMIPIRMHPAFRFGSDTPWGGDRLRTEFGKKTPDPRTGESLEISVIPSLNSKDDHGNLLSALIAKYGSLLTGEGFQHEFPLLLKLLDAREKLSVQVHPDDVLARKLEGKLGKSEAWVILHAEPGAKIVYGTVPGTTKEMLLEASMDGASLEKFLRFVPVKAGDVFDIPAGTIHAIGSGIMLYEIQQSSDVTYRLYDWNKRDVNGNKRDLHIQRGIEAADINARFDASVPGLIKSNDQGTRLLLLQNKHFTIERWKNCNAETYAPDCTRFRIITALSDAVFYGADNENKLLCLKRGESAIIPATCEMSTVNCGDMLIAYPSV